MRWLLLSTAVFAAGCGAEGDGGGDGLPAAAIRIVQDGLDGPSSLFLERKTLYWVEENSGEVKRFLPSGADYSDGNVTTLKAGLTEVRAVTANLTHYAYLHGFEGTGQVAIIEKASGTGFAVLNQFQPNSAVFGDDGFLYWSNTSLSGGVHRVALTGDAQPETLAKNQGGPDGVAVLGDHVYWSNSIDGTVMRSPRALSQPTELVRGQDFPERTVATGQHVYWLNAPLFGDEDGALMAMEPAASQSWVLASGLNDPSGMAVDATHVYWAERGAGTISRIPRGGGQVEVIAGDQDSPSNVAVSDEYVFWAIAGAEGNDAIVYREK